MTARLPPIPLENDFLRLAVLPEPGAKIYDLIAKPSGRNYLWHNPRIEPQPYPIDSNFDNYWCGGWDDIFPTADSCEHKGEVFPNCGELRSLRWHVESADSGRVVLSAFGPISPVRAEKTVRIAGGVVAMTYSLRNLGPRELDFLWGTHPAIAVKAGDILRVPAKTGLVAISSTPAMGTPGERYDWPFVEHEGGRTDMSRVQPVTASVNCGHYAMDLSGGWFAVEDAEDGSGILFRFPLELCPYLWMWLVYGGWRGYHHAIIEPWTGYPVNLAEAVRAGRNRTLAAGETFEATVRATPYHGSETWEKALERIDKCD